MEFRDISGGSLIFRTTSDPTNTHVIRAFSFAMHGHPDMNENTRTEFLCRSVPGQNYSVSAYISRGQTRAHGMLTEVIVRIKSWLL